MTQPDSREVQTFAVNATARITCNACGSHWHEGHAQVCSRPDLQARVAELEAALRAIDEKMSDGKNGPGHGHLDPGIWDNDSSNGDLAGKPCEWCAQWNATRAALDR